MQRVKVSPLLVWRKAEGEQADLPTCSAGRDVRVGWCDPRVRPGHFSQATAEDFDSPEPNIGELATAQAEIGRLQTLVDLLMTRLESGPPSPTQQRHHPYARSPKKLLSSGHTVEDAEALLSFANSPTTSPTESFVSPAQFFPLPPTESTSPSFPAPATFPLPPRALPPPSPSPAFPPSSAFQTHFAQPYPIAPTRTAVKTEAAKKHEARYDAAISAFLATRAWEGVAPSLGAGGSTLVGEGRTQLGVTIGDVVAGGMVMGVEQEVRGEVVGQGLVLSDVRNERGQMGEEGREEVMEWKQMARV